MRLEETGGAIAPDSDMHGNLWEWCADDWCSNYNSAPTDGSAWLTEDKNTSRLLRGGSWSDNAVDCRSAYRNYYSPRFQYGNRGFRVACS